MIDEIQPNRAPSTRNPVSTIVVALIALCALFPPETRGPAMIGCALLIALLAALTWRAGDGRDRARLALAVALSLTIPGAFAAVAPSAAVEPLSLAVLALAAGCGAATLAGRAREARLAALALAIAAAGVALHAIYQELWGFDRLAAVLRGAAELPDHAALVRRVEGGRAFAGFATPAALGGFLVISLPVTLGLARSADKIRRTLWLVLAALQVGAFAAAASATAAVALLAATALAMLFWSRWRRMMLVGLLALSALFVVVVAQRGTLLFDTAHPDSPLRLRAGNARAALAMAGDHPWTGVGIGGFGEAYPGYRASGDNETRHAHNIALEWIAECGWPAGLLLSAAFFVAFLAPMWRESSEGAAWRRGAAVGLAAFAIHNLADFTAFMPSILWTAALLRGLLARPARPADPSPAARTVVVAGAVAVVAAVALAGLGAAGTESRISAREASFAGERQRALSLAERGARLAPWDVDAVMTAAQARLGSAADPASADPAAALAHADRAIALAPRRPGARALRARIRAQLGDLPGAYADLAEAARCYPLHTGYTEARDAMRARLGQGRAR